MFRRIDESTIRTGERISTRLGLALILENGDRAIVQILSIKFGNQPSNLCEYCFRIDKSAIRLSERRSTRLELVLLES